MDHVTLSNLYAAANSPDKEAHKAIQQLHTRIDALEVELERQRARQARMLRSKGWTIREVAEMFDVSTYRVRKWTTSNR